MNSFSCTSWALPLKSKIHTTYTYTYIIYTYLGNKVIIHTIDTKKNSESNSHNRSFFLHI